MVGSFAACNREIQCRRRGCTEIASVARMAPCAVCPSLLSLEKSSARGKDAAALATLPSPPPAPVRTTILSGHPAPARRSNDDAIHAGVHFMFSSGEDVGMVGSFAACNLYRRNAAMPSPGLHGEVASVASRYYGTHKTKAIRDRQTAALAGSASWRTRSMLRRSGAVCPSLLSLEKSSKWIDASDRYVDGVA